MRNGERTRKKEKKGGKRKKLDKKQKGIKKMMCKTTLLRMGSEAEVKGNVQLRRNQKVKKPTLKKVV